MPVICLFVYYYHLSHLSEVLTNTIKKQFYLYEGTGNPCAGQSMTANEEALRLTLLSFGNFGLVALTGS